MFSVDFTQIGLANPEKTVRMGTGSASLNYYVKNKDGEFLVKFLPNNRPMEKFRKNLTKISGLKNAPVFLYETAFQDYHVFVFKWIEGKYVFLEKLSENGFRELIRAYLNFSQEINENPPIVVDPVYDMTKAVVSFTPPFFIKGELEKIKKDLSYTPPPHMKIIHGDFHFKNILFKQDGFQGFLDFETIRYGLPTEDLIRLILTNAEQHNFFREKYTLNLLKIMMEETPYSKEEWLYGLDSFILLKYQKRIIHKKNSLRQKFLMFYNNFLYSKVRRTIQG